MPERLARYARLTAQTVVIIVAVGGLTVAAIRYAGATGTFDLRHIEVQGTHVLTRADVVRALAIPLEVNLFQLDLPALQERLEALDYVFGVRLGRRFPHVLFVDVVEETPLAYVAASEYFTLTAQGSTLPLPHGRFELEIPTVSGVAQADAALSAGSAQGHASLEKARRLLSHMAVDQSALYHDLSEMVFTSDDNVVLYMAESSTPVFLGNRDLLPRIGVLSAFLRTIAHLRTLRDYSHIDLRYDGQVVVLERNS